jgi:hypothetical protein
MESPKHPGSASIKSAHRLDYILEVKMGSIHLIRIPDEEDDVRAIAAFRRVPITRVRFPGNVMGVTSEHIAELKKDKIPFQYLSKEPKDGQSPEAV